MIEKKQSLQKAYIPKAVLKENFNSGRTTEISPSGMDGMLMLEGKSPTRTLNRTDTILLDEAFPIANKQHSMLKSDAAADLMEQPNWKNEMDVGQTEHRAKRVQIPAFNNLSASLIDDNFFINRKRFIKGYREDSFSASEEQRHETSSELSLLDVFNAFQKQVVRRLPSLKDDHLTAKKHRQRRTLGTRLYIPILFMLNVRGQNGTTYGMVYHKLHPPLVIIHGLLAEISMSYPS